MFKEIKTMMDAHADSLIDRYGEFVLGRPKADNKLIDDHREYAVLVDNCVHNYGEEAKRGLSMCLEFIMVAFDLGIEVEMTYSRHCGWNDNGELVRGREIHLDELRLLRPDKLYLYLYNGEFVYGFTSNDEGTGAVYA